MSEWKHSVKMKPCVRCGVSQRPEELKSLDNEEGICHVKERCDRWLKQRITTGGW